MACYLPWTTGPRIAGSYLSSGMWGFRQEAFLFCSLVSTVIKTYNIDLALTVLCPGPFLYLPFRVPDLAMNRGTWPCLSCQDVLTPLGPQLKQALPPLTCSHLVHGYRSNSPKAVIYFISICFTSHTGNPTRTRFLITEPDIALSVLSSHQQMCRKAYILNWWRHGNEIHNNGATWENQNLSIQMPNDSLSFQFWKHEDDATLRRDKFLHSQICLWDVGCVSSDSKHPSRPFSVFPFLQSKVSG